MEFGIVSILLLVFAAACIIGSLKLLIAKDYFIQFLRGFAGFWLLVIAFCVVMSSLNLASYSQLIEGQTIANISFTKKDEQEYEATIVNVATGQEEVVDLVGDMWQMDARILRVVGSNTPFYKLERVSGRFYSLEQERSNPKSVFGIEGKSMGFDLFNMFKGSKLGVVKAGYGSATYLPMSDGASFSVNVAATGLTGKPINETARNIVSEWK